MENYTPIKVVGKGTFGQALLVKSKKDGQQYIIKQIKISSMNEKEKQEALNEVRVLSSLNHPNIVKYITSFMSDGKLCIVMEYAEGGDIYQRIKNQKGAPFKEEVIVNWFIQICLAVKHIHDRKILHRDLKTQNIFITKDETIKLGDFGIARVLKSTMECARTLVGTPYYLSPELCQEKPYNTKSDVWSLGCVLYEMITLKHAFEGANMKALVGKILRGIYPSISPSYSKDLRDLTDSLLQKDPNKRPSINSILKTPFIHQKILQQIDSASNNNPIPVVKKEVSVPIKQDEVKKKEEPPALDLHKKMELLKQKREAEERMKMQQMLEQQQQKRFEYEKKIKVLENALQAAMHQKEVLVKKDGVSRPSSSKENVRPDIQVAQPAMKLHAAPSAKVDVPAVERRSREDELAEVRRKLYWEMRQQAEQNKKKIQDSYQTHFEAPTGIPQPSKQEKPEAPSKRTNAVEKQIYIDKPTTAQPPHAHVQLQKPLILDAISQTPNKVPQSILKKVATPESIHKKHVEFTSQQQLQQQQQQQPVTIEDDNSTFEDEPIMRTPVNQMKFRLNGNTIRLKISESDSLMYRIESLKTYLDRELGESLFLTVYHLINDQTSDDDEDEMDRKLQDILGSERLGYVSLIHQLIFCEDKINEQNNK